MLQAAAAAEWQRQNQNTGRGPYHHPTMTATTTTLLGATLHAYRAALAALKAVSRSAPDSEYNRCYGALLGASIALEDAMPSDRDLCFVLDDNCELWALERGNHRRTGEGWPDSSFPTVTKVEDLICN